MDVYTQNAHLTLLEDAQSRLLSSAETGCFTCILDSYYYQRPELKSKIDQLLRSSFSHSSGAIYWLSSGDLFIFFSEKQRYLLDCFRIFLKTLKRIRLSRMTSKTFDLQAEWMTFVKIYVEKVQKIDVDFFMSHPESRDLYHFYHNLQLRQVRDTPKALVLAEDHVQENIRYCLKDENYDYCKASSANIAFEKYTSSAPEIAFIDVDLAKDKALTLVRDIYSLDPDCFVIILGTDLSDETIVSYANLGVKALINKPFSKNVVSQHLDEHKSILESIAGKMNDIYNHDESGLMAV